MRLLRYLILCIGILFSPLVLAASSGDSDSFEGINVAIEGFQIDVSNSRNSVDWVGKAHNDGVRYVLERIDLSTDMDMEVFIDELVKEYSLSALGAELRIEQEVKSSELNKFIGELGNILENQDYCLPELIWVIKQLERKASRSMEEKDLVKFYAIASIARYSAEFWTSKRKGGQNGMRFLKPQTDSSSKIDPGPVIRADFWGFVTGGWKGAVIASIFAILRQILED